MSLAEPQILSAQFTLAHYERMVERGVFAAPFRRRLELIRGRIVEMSPIGSRHASTVTKLTNWSYASVGGDVTIRVQSPLRLPQQESEPEPDVVWAKNLDYAEQHPNPEQVLLVIEVAESSRDFDRGAKLDAYAEAGIPEYWVVDLIDSRVEAYRQPSGGKYLEVLVASGVEKIAPLSAPNAVLKVEEVF